MVVTFFPSEEERDVRQERRRVARSIPAPQKSGDAHAEPDDRRSDRDGETVRKVDALADARSQLARLQARTRDELADNGKGAGSASRGKVVRIDGTEVAPTVHDLAEVTCADAEQQRMRIGDLALRLLGARGMSRWELRQALLKHEFDDSIVEAELDRLAELNLLGDAELAVTIVEREQRSKGSGRGAITQTLSSRHLEQSAIDAALATLDDDDEQKRATELAMQRASRMAAVDEQTLTRRLYAFLSRRGYSGSTIRTAITAALASRS